MPRSLTPTEDPQAAAADPADEPAAGRDAATTEPPAAHDPLLSVSARDVALAELRRLTALWAQHEPGARSGADPEELHQLRIAARRIDATLALFRGQLPIALVRARRHTKALLRSLGATRDFDVQLAALDAHCKEAPDAERAAAQPLRAWLAHERERSRTRMLRTLDSESTRRWLELLGNPPGSDPVPDDAALALVVLPARVERRFRKLRKSVRRLRRKSSMEDYHRVRRRAKQLRYAIECGAPFFGRPGEELLSALRRLQNRLGAQQDAYTAQQRLTALAADPTAELPPATLFLMGRLAGHYALVTGDARATLLRAWRKVRKRRWRTLRARLLALAEAATVPLEHPAPAAGASASDPPAALAPAALPLGPDVRPLRH